MKLVYTSHFFCPRGCVLFSVLSHCIECRSRPSLSCLEASLSCWNACLLSLENLLQRILFQQPSGCQWGLGFASCDDSEALCQFFQAWSAWAPTWVTSCFNYWRADSQALPCFTIPNLQMIVSTMLLVRASNSQRLLTLSFTGPQPHHLWNSKIPSSKGDCLRKWTQESWAQNWANGSNEYKAFRFRVVCHTQQSACTRITWKTR